MLLSCQSARSRARARAHKNKSVLAGGLRPHPGTFEGNVARVHRYGACQCRHDRCEACDQARAARGGLLTLAGRVGVAGATERALSRYPARSYLLTYNRMASV